MYHDLASCECNRFPINNLITENEFCTVLKLTISNSAQCLYIQPLYTSFCGLYRDIGCAHSIYTCCALFNEGVITPYVTIHGKTNHVALELNMRYDPNKLPMMIIINSVEESLFYTKNLLCELYRIILCLPS